MQDKMPRKPMTLPGKRTDGVRAINESMNRTFAANVHELNERLKQAGMPLHYHNGFIQITQDEQLQQQVEQPFWLLVGDAAGLPRPLAKQAFYALQMGEWAAGNVARALAGRALREFVPNGAAWAHLDIAGPMFKDKEWKYFDAGAIGFGVKTLVDLCERFRDPVA